MRANALVVVAVLSTGAASVAHASGLGGALRYAPRVATSPAWVEPPIDEAPRSSDASPFSISGPGVDQRRARQRGPRHDATGAVPGTVSGAVGGGVQSAAVVRQATLDAIDEVKRSLEGIEAARAQLASRPPERHPLRWTG